MDWERYGINFLNFFRSLHSILLNLSIFGLFLNVVIIIS